MMNLNRRAIFSGATGKDVCLSNQRGVVLIVSMLALCLLSLLGIWALNTSDFELKTASNAQKLASNFNIVDGAAIQVGAQVGYAAATNSPWFQIQDPSTFPQYLNPTTASDYDPGNDITLSGSYPADFEASNDQSWPRGNLLGDKKDNTEDYAYLVTYLNPDTPPKGYNAANFSSYKFRIDAEKNTVVEMGGIKVGVKAD